MKKYYVVSYRGTEGRYRNFREEIPAESKREAVEKIYSAFFNSDYFPQEDGSIKDAGGNTVADSNSETIDVSGGVLYAETISGYEYSRLASAQEVDEDTVEVIEGFFLGEHEGELRSIDEDSMLHRIGVKNLSTGETENVLLVATKSCFFAALEANPGAWGVFPKSDYTIEEAASSMAFGQI